MKSLLGIAVSVLIFTSSSSSALELKVTDRENFSAAQSQKLDQAIVVLDQILNTPEFKEAILNFSYQGKLGFIQNNGKSNLEIYEALMAGAEQFPSPRPADGVADMRLSIYTPPFWKPISRAIAFTSPSDPFLHVYNRYYNNASIADISNTVIHEWTHKMGFDHDFNATPERPYSVPYGVGGIVKNLVSKFLGQ